MYGQTFFYPFHTSLHSSTPKTLLARAVRFPMSSSTMALLARYLSLFASSSIVPLKTTLCQFSGSVRADD